MILTIHTIAEHSLLADIGAQWRRRLGDERTQLVIQALYHCLTIRDPLTAAHSMHMAKLTYEVAVEFDKPNADLYFAGALTHDIGKLGMTDRILKGDSKLAPQDREHLHKHVSDGYRLLNSLAMPRIVLDIVRYHHERYDGSGYLAGLNGKEIPLPGRIAGITDTFSALTSNRLYSKALSNEDAIKIMLGEQGKFDPEILEFFVSKIASDEMGQ